jgi:hypothetical protein
MNDFELALLDEREYAEFTREMQKAFQHGYEEEFGHCDSPILPERDISDTLNAVGSVAYIAKVDGQMVGGAIVKIDPETQHNSLELLFARVGAQNKGVGLLIWHGIEKLYPETRVWETCTPYFEKRNIHFYVNRCGFHIVEFFNPWHKDPNEKDEPIGGMSDEAGQYFLRFEKVALLSFPWVEPGFRR